LEKEEEEEEDEEEACPKYHFRHALLILFLYE
jgi:hypothetical protein